MINHLASSVGDVVTIKLEDEVMIKTALLSYGIPLAALVSGALLGGWLWPEASDIASISVGGCVYIGIVEFAIFGISSLEGGCLSNSIK